MMRRTALLIAALAAALAAAALQALPALAAAGGGSASFGGGGGGGGGGFGGGGAGFGGGGLGGGGRTGSGGFSAIGVIVLALIVIVFLAIRGAGGGRSRRAGRRRSPTAARGRVPSAKQTAARERSVELAAAVAAEDDPAFAPEAVRADAARLFREIQAAWSENDITALTARVGDDLLVEWRRRLDDFARRGWRNRVEVLGEPEVRYVGLSNREGSERDQVVVRIDARLRDDVIDRAGARIHRDDARGDTVQNREYWTLQRDRGGWRLIAVEQLAEGAHVLRDEILAEPADGRELRDASLVEGAVADAVPAGTRIAELADLDFAGPARAAANDLSVADGRFAPDVLEVAARRAVAAWAEAVDGADAALEAIADPGVIRQLLYPGDHSARTRLVVRGPAVERIEIAALNAAADPPEMTLAVSLRGARYLQNRDTTAIVSGDPGHVRSFTEHWTLALSDDPQQPWRLVAVAAPTSR